MMSTTRLLYWAGGLSILASVVHGALVEAHFAEWWVFGALFMLAAMLQGLYGFAILSSHVMNGAPIHERWTPRSLRAFYLLGIAGNAGLMLVYVASRTVGVLGEREAWDALGVLTNLVEAATILALVVALRRAGGSAPSQAGPSGSA